MEVGPWDISRCELVRWGIVALTTFALTSWWRKRRESEGMVQEKKPKAVARKEVPADKRKILGTLDSAVAICGDVVEKRKSIVFASLALVAAVLGLVVGLGVIFSAAPIQYISTSLFTAQEAIRGDLDKASLAWHAFLSAPPALYLSTLLVFCICAMLFLFPILAREKGASRADEYWEKNAYSVIRVFAVVGASLLFASIILFKGMDTLRGTYYFLLFTGGGLAAAIATWRGRQFEKQLHLARLEKAVEMATDKENKIRNTFGAATLSKLLASTPNLPTETKTVLSITAKVFLSYDEKYRNWYWGDHGDPSNKPLGKKRVKKIIDYISTLPQISARAFFLLLAKASSLEVTDEPFVGKSKIIWGEASRPAGAWMIFPYIDMDNVAYLATEDISEKIFANQIWCIYFVNDITNSTMQNVDFWRSMFFSVRFTDTDLSGSRFQQTRVDDTIFGKNVSLKNASFKGAICIKCRFSGADISGCNFTTTKGIEPKHFKGARCSEREPIFPQRWKTSRFWRSGDKEWNSWDEFLAHLRKNAEEKAK